MALTGASPPVRRGMPLLPGFMLAALCIWFAGNPGTFARVWTHPRQHRVWHGVPPEKTGSWRLLMVISCVMVSAPYRRALPE